MPDATAALEILDLSLIPGTSPPMYAVGIAASRITIADQQRRAVNLIWALLREGRVTAGSRIAIVGGGLSGATAAVYALSQHLRVTVFEKFDDAFPLQQGSARWIHPNVYDWPADGWRNDETNLPCMNWRAATAGEVVAKLRKEWLVHRDHEGLEWKPRTEIVGAASTVDGAMLLDDAGGNHGPFAAIVLACGFGEEATRPDIDARPYWRDDDLHQRLRTGGTALVSGCGDGGLVDAVRVALRDFRHDWLANVARCASADLAFVSALLKVERNTPGYPDGERLTKATLDIPAPAAASALISAQLRPNTKIILNAGSDGPFTRSACLLNRFLVAELMRLGVVSYQRGKLETASLKRAGSQFVVSIAGSDIMVDAVVIRHGPEVRSLARLPDVDAALRPARDFLRTYRAGVDRTRARAWGALPGPSSPGVERLPAASGAIMDYLAQSLRDAVKDELSRREIRAVVGYVCKAQAIELNVSIGARDEKLSVTVVSPAVIEITHARIEGTPRTTSVTLTNDVMQDAGSAAPILAAKVPDLMHWLLEETA